MRLLLFVSGFVGLVSSLTCPCGYDEASNGICYKTYTDPMTRGDVYQRCLADGALLVEFPNAYSSTFVKGLTSGLSVSSFWIGATCSDTTTSSCQYDSGNAVYYEEFKGGKPDEKKGGPCVLMFPQNANSWTSSRCYDKAPAVCQYDGKTAAIQCPAGYSVFAGKCYKAIGGGSQSAQEGLCTNEGGHLTSIHSIGENTYVADLVTATFPSSTSSRIGMTIDSSKTDHWLDGSKVDYKHFSTTSGSFGCVEMVLNQSPDGLSWHPADCGNTVPSVCKRNGSRGIPLPTVCPTTSTTTTSTTTTTPTSTTTRTTSTTTTLPVTTTSVPTTSTPDEITSGCNEGLRVGEGEIFTRYYPMDYRNNEYCLYRLGAEPGKKVELSFRDFDLENVYDFVIIYDGPDTDSRILAKLSGRRSPFVATSSGSFFTVVFQSDPANRFRGFRAEFRSV